MAGVLKTLSNNKTFDILFDGALLSSTRALLVIELLKYFMYERQQIPLPVDQLASLLKEELNTIEGQSQRQIKQSNNKSAAVAAKCQKVQSLLDDLNTLFKHLQRAFENCPEIEQVSILFGGTVVSPKESYIIKFPPPCPDADCLPLKSCQRNLFQQMIRGNFLGSLNSSLSPTNIIVLLNAPRSCSLQWFLPKQHLKAPKHGAVIGFNLMCSYLVPCSHDLTMAEGADFELSGLEPLNCSQCETSATDDSSNTVNENVHSCSIGAGGSSPGEEEQFRISSRCNNGTGAALSLNNPTDSLRVCDGNNGASSPSLPRFCPHHKLNYIYSSEKYQHVCKESKHIASSESRDSDIASLSSRTERLTLSPIPQSEWTNRDADCIWYQSPLTIKGLKMQDMFPGKPL